MLSLEVKSDVRRHLKYPALNQSSGDALSYINWDQSSLILERRMDSLSPVSGAKISGLALGTLAMVGREPEPGDQISIVISSTLLESDETIGPIVAVDGDTQILMARKLAQAIADNPTLASAEIAALGPFGPGLSDKQIVIPEVAVSAPGEFAMSASFSGSMGVSVPKQGKFTEPSVVVSISAGVENKKYGYVPILNFLEGAIGSSTQRAHLARAEGFVRSDEIRERQELYRFFVNQLADFLGVPINSSASGTCSGFIL